MNWWTETAAAWRLPTLDRVGSTLTGTADLRSMPTELLELFSRFETAVDGQVLSSIDSIEDEIAALGLVVKTGDGCELPACDLQVFPAAGRISFRLPAVALS